MYGNLAKHAILKVLSTWTAENDEKPKKSRLLKASVFMLINLNYRPFILPSINIYRFKFISVKSLKRSLIHRYYQYLLIENFIEHHVVANEVFVSITDKGVSYAADNYFISKHNEYKSLLFRDFCTLAVAFATCYTLLFSIGQSKGDSVIHETLSSRIDSLENALSNNNKIQLQKSNDTNYSIKGLNPIDSLR